MIRTIFLRAKRNQNLATIVINRGPTGPKGDDGSGGGDMAAATYDPQGIADDAFAMENMTEGADAKVMTAAERNAIAALGTASTREADQDLRTTDAVEFDTVTAETVNLHTAAFDITNGGPTALGEMAWDSVDGTLDIMADGGVKIAVGEDGLIRVRNTSGATIAKGAPLVYVGTNGASTRINVRPWIGESISDVRQFLGFAAGAIADNADGYAVWFGKIAEIPTDGGADLWDDGDILYAIPSASATLSNIRPTSGDFVTAAVVINAGSGTSGSVFVRPSFDTVPAASVINFDDLGDATTADLPTINTPLSTALGLKADTASLGTAAFVSSDQNLRTDDAVEFASVSISEMLALNPTTEPASPIRGTIYLDSTINRLRIWDGLAWQDFSPFNPFTIDPLFAYYAELSMLANGGGAAAQGDSIATLDDLSANGIDATQATALYQPIAYDADNGGPFARFDGSNDRMTFTLASPIVNGTVFFATKKGSYAANIDLAAGTHDFSGNKLSNTNYNFANDLVALLLFDFVLSQSQIDQLKAFFVAKGAVEDYGAITTFTNAFRGNNYTTFPSINTSSGTNFPAAWMFSYRLVSFPLIVVTAGSAFSYTWFNCPLLAHFPANFFDNWNPSVITSGVFDGTWGNCSLTSQSVENILTSIDTSGRWATTNGASGGTPLGDPVIDIDYDGGTLTTATTNAISNLKGKGWGITINGVLQ